MLALFLQSTMAALGIELMGWSRPDAEARVARSIEDALRRVFTLADADGLITTEAARRIADERLAIAPGAAIPHASRDPSV